jgi:2-keto-4-pentenoate hydratase/2-oxohepta-3-ene-1,7-dioic acid hydratase in catechol pathway
LASFTVDGRRGVGVVEGEEIVDLTTAMTPAPRDMTELLTGGFPALAHAAAAAQSTSRRIPLDAAILEAPVRPRTFFAIGLNYADHVAESGLDTPTRPTVFLKASSCVVGPHADIERPVASDQLDYEGELGVVIGRRSRHVPAARAREVIAGYLVVNDVSVRDWQTMTPQWSLGKSFDTHGPIGPWIVTADELEPHDLPIRTWVNGELRQDSNTKYLIFNVFDIIETLSTVCTLQPGDIIATGTSSGVALAREGQPWLVPGDRVRVEVEGVGAIENRVVQETVALDDAVAATATEPA